MAKFIVTVSEDRILTRETVLQVFADDEADAQDIANDWPFMTRAARRKALVKRVSLGQWTEDEDSGHWDVLDVEEVL